MAPQDLSVSVLASELTVIGRHWSTNIENRDPYCRLYLVTGGSGDLRLDDEPVFLKPSYLYLLPERRSVRFGNAVGMKHYWFHITINLPGAHSFFSVYKTPVACEAGSAEREFAEDAVASRSGLPFVTVNRVRRLLEPFVDQAVAFREPSGLTRFRSVFDYIERHLGERITNEALAAIVNLHPTYFSNRFTSDCGVSPMTYVLNRRIESAQLRLLHSDLPLKAIAEELGFADGAYFSRVFKSRTGLTPGEYRARGVL